MGELNFFLNRETPTAASHDSQPTTSGPRAADKTKSLKKKDFWEQTDPQCPR